MEDFIKGSAQRSQGFGHKYKKALSLARVKNVDCFAHQTLIVVKNSIMSPKCVSDLITKCRLIATHFNHSVVAQNELKKIQTRLNVRPLFVMQDIQTRWNSSMHMLERMSEINEVICLYASSSTKIKPLTANENDILNNCINILKPFEELANTISSAESCLSDGIPLVSTLKVVLTNVIKSKGVSGMTETLMKEMNGRFENLEYDDAYTIATFLDPRYKTKFFKQFVSQNVKIKLGCLCDQMIETAKITPFKKKQKLSDTKETKYFSLSIAKSMKDLLASSSDEESQSEVSKDTISIIENYLKLPRLEADKDQLVWWRDNCKSFPFLPELARTYSACPSTSVVSERLFSGAASFTTKCEPNFHLK